MIQFAKEPLTDALWAEAMPLLHAHWKEVAAFQDIPLNPDRDLYAASEEAGILRVFTARDHYEGETIMDASCWHPRRLVGYALYFVRPAPHFRSSLQAVQDVLYLAKEQRGRTALRFIDWCDGQLRAEGCQCVYQHLKAAHAHGHRAVLHLGYVEVDRIYARRLDVPRGTSEEAKPEMGQDWRDQAELDYNTVRAQEREAIEMGSE